MSLLSAYMTQKSERGRGNCGWALLERRGASGPLELAFDEELARAGVIGVAGAACIGMFRACRASGGKPLKICTGTGAELAVACFWAALRRSMSGEGSPLRFSGMLSNDRWFGGLWTEADPSFLT